jgi:hypothetical protein
MCAPYDIELTEGELRAKAVQRIAALNENFNPVITIDRR